MSHSFFELDDAVEIPGRWHLGDAALSDGTEPNLFDGHRFDTSRILAVDVQYAGRILDFSLTAFAIPVVSARLASAIGAIAGSDVQFVPTRIEGATGMFALNTLRFVDCLDEARSKFLKWTTLDHRADLAGQYRMIAKRVLDAKAIPEGVHVFRFDPSPISLVVTGQIKEAMEAAGCLGAHFTELPT